MENYSDISTAVSSDYGGAVALFLTIEQAVVIAIGIVVNFIIMFTMPLAKMNRRIKLILTALAFADLGAVVMNGLVNAALTSIVQLFTNQQFLVSSLNLSACLSTQFLADFFEASVQWITAFLTVERFYVVYFPFKAAQLRLRTTLLIVIGSFLLCFIATSPHFAYYTITSVGGACVPDNTDYATSMSYFVIRHLVYEHVIAPGIILICNTLVLFKLARREKLKKREQITADKKSGEGSKLKITITLVVVSTVHISGFIPCGIFCLIWYLNSNTIYAAMTYQNAVISYAVYGVMHFVNFIIYVASMDAYRHVLANPPICKYKTKK